MRNIQNCSRQFCQPALNVQFNNSNVSQHFQSALNSQLDDSICSDTRSASHYLGNISGCSQKYCQSTLNAQLNNFNVAHRFKSAFKARSQLMLYPLFNENSDFSSCTDSQQSNKLQITLRKGIRFSQKQRLKLKKRSSKSTMKHSCSCTMLLTLTSLLLLPYSFNSQALSASTARTIEGSAPYIEINGAKAQGGDGLLQISVAGVNYISDSTGAMKIVKSDGTRESINMITTPNATDRFSDIGLLVPADDTPYSINNVSVIPNSARMDDDDDDGDGNITLSGDLKISIKDNEGNAITNFANNLEVCSSPYTITVTASNNPYIMTQYGAPNRTNYNSGKAIYKIQPNKPTLCYLLNSAAQVPETRYYPGPAAQWNATYGFIPQTYGSDYDRNYPTRGKNNAEVYLDIRGVPHLENTSWTSTSSSPEISAQIDNLSGRALTPYRFILKGPAIPSDGLSTLPADITLEGKDENNTTLIKYQFSIKRWNLPSVISTSSSVSWFDSWAACSPFSPNKAAIVINVNKYYSYYYSQTQNLSAPAASALIDDPSGKKASIRIGGSDVSEYMQAGDMFVDILGSPSGNGRERWTLFGNVTVSDWDSVDITPKTGTCTHPAPW